MRKTNKEKENNRRAQAEGIFPMRALHKQRAQAEGTFPIRTLHKQRAQAEGTFPMMALHKQRAQAATEYLMIAAFLIIVIGIAYLYSSTILSNSIDD